MNVVLLNPYWAHETYDMVPYVVATIIATIFISVLIAVWMYKCSPEEPLFSQDQEKRIREIVKEEAGK